MGTGLQQGLTQVAVNMLREGIDLAQIAKLTALPIERIKSLQANDTDDFQILVKDFMQLSGAS